MLVDLILDVYGRLANMASKTNGEPTQEANMYMKAHGLFSMIASRINCLATKELRISSDYTA